jgi:hypothetical protein
MNKIEFLYNNKNLTTREIAKTLNISKGSVYNYMKRFNIQARKNGSWQRKYSFNHTYFTNINNDSAYWAGFIAADGCIKNNYVIISLANKDLDHLEKFRECLQSDTVIYPAPKNCSRIQFVSKDMVCDLQNNFNITERKTFCLQPPNIYNEEYIRSFIRGVFDGDGCFGHYQNTLRFSFICMSELFIIWVKNNLQQFTNLSIPIRYIHTKNNVKELYLSGIKASKVLNWMYLNPKLFLERKYKKYLSYKENGIL